MTPIFICVFNNSDTTTKNNKKEKEFYMLRKSLIHLRRRYCPFSIFNSSLVYNWNAASQGAVYPMLGGGYSIIEFLR